MVNLSMYFSSPFTYIFALALTSIVVKCYLFITLFLKKVRSSQAHKSWVFLLIVLVTSIMVDISWCIGTLNSLFDVPIINEFIYRKIILSMAWGAVSLQYLFLALFLESLIEKKYKFRWYHYIYSLVSGGWFVYWFINACFNFSLGKFTYSTMITQSLILLLTLGIVYKKKYSATLPLILKKQLTLLLGILSFFVVTETLPYGAYFIGGMVKIIFYSRLFQFFSTVFLTLAIIFSAKRIIGMRFLNYSDHVQTEQKYKFVDIFKDALGKLGYAFQVTELKGIVEHFFSELFTIKTENIHLYIRNISDGIALSTTNERVNKVEDFLTIHDKESELYKLLSSTKIWIRDELEFSDFYEDRQVLKDAVVFLKSINADIFLPIFDQRGIMLSYIIIDHNARPKELYNDVERDEMLIFVSYLSNVIYLFQHKNLDAMIQKEKELSEELYYKHQEIAQYKESIRSFVRSAQDQRKIGLLFYKNRKFVFGNQAAHDLIPVNINIHQGHPLTKVLKDVAQGVEEHKIQKSAFAQDGQGHRLVVNGFPHIEQNNVILTVYYPEISDLLNNQVHELKDPSEWDYVLYLQTTYSGQLINKLIPGNGPELVKFKIDLLKTALSKKATLLELCEEDGLAVAEIVHLISLRQEMHVLKLEAPNKGSELLVKLCGMNPIFGMQAEKALLDRLNEVGTLYIQNIHFLSPETQQVLAEYIKYGFYKPYKSEQRIVSSVRIIASTTQDLSRLVSEGKFSAELLNELKKASIIMPSLLTLSDQEFASLAEGYVEQAIQTQTYKNLLELTDAEKNKLTIRRPATLQEFKARIQSLLVTKSKKNQIEVHLDPAYNINDPELAQAARLGKHALRDARIMNMLWNKFKNQSKIATFLGVNRSSVNRKVRELNLS